MNERTKRAGQMVTRGMSLPRDLNERLVEQARAEDRTISSVIRRALRLYLGRNAVVAQQVNTGGSQTTRESCDIPG